MVTMVGSYECWNNSDIIMLLISNAISFKKSKTHLLDEMKCKMDGRSWSTLIMHAIQQALETNMYRFEECQYAPHAIRGVIPSKAIYRLFKLGVDFSAESKKMFVNFWNNEATKLELMEMKVAQVVLSAKYRIKTSFLMFDILKTLLIDSFLLKDELHVFYTFIQLNFVGNFSLLHATNWIGSIFGRKILCPVAREILNEIMEGCCDDVFREISLFVIGNPEMMNEAKLVDNHLFKTMSSRYFKFGRTKTILISK